MLFRFDLHVHSWYSGDATDSPEELIAAARSKGLAGIAITDHNSCEAHRYCLENGLSKADGLPVNEFLVIPAVEVSTAEGHLLCYGVSLPCMIGVPCAEVIELVEQQGGVAVPAHPYDQWRAGIRESVLESLPLCALEIFNAAVTSRVYNEKARAYALRRNLTPIAGSDAHRASAVGTAVTCLELEQLSVAEVLNALRSSTPILEENYLTRSEGIKKHLANWFRFINRRPPIV
jgi:predicted metal-dependent phosphoesterase TrpH